MEGKPDTQFASWLRATLAAKNQTVRGLAQGIAADYPGGATVRNVETVRRALNKYLHEGRLPSAPMRAAIAAALGVGEGEIPGDDDSESDTVAALEAISREQRALGERLSRIGKRLGVGS
jgi:transcriptional regulator with XRE-family HTH domain